MGHKIKALKLSTDGVLTPLELDDGGDLGILDDMYQQINCTTVEVVELCEELTAWVDEDGFLHEQTVNPWLMELAVTFGVPVWSPLVGAAILTGGADDEGETVGISDELAAEVQRLVEAMHRSRVVA